jgi:hypothetical protein
MMDDQLTESLGSMVQRIYDALIEWCYTMCQSIHDCVESSGLLALSESLGMQFVTAYNSADFQICLNHIIGDENYMKEYAAWHNARHPGRRVSYWKLNRKQRIEARERFGR